MEPARIAALLEPFLHPSHSEPGQRPGEEPAFLSPAQLQHISTYIDILLHWNARINLTAVRNEEEIVTRHFGESLFAARHLFPKSAGGAAGAAGPEPGRKVGPVAPTSIHLADLGSGAGFPGIPIKLWAPQVHVTLIESNHKKATFLREVVRALTLTNIDIQNSRAESLTGQAFDTVTLRAVERFESVLPVAAGLVVPTGRLAILIGSSQFPQAQAALSKWSWSSRQPIPFSQNRMFLVGWRSEAQISHLC
jgi:16S rRNA (guanine527-N7)-methyltransferase